MTYKIQSADEDLSSRKSTLLRQDSTKRYSAGVKDRAETMILEKYAEYPRKRSGGRRVTPLGVGE